MGDKPEAKSYLMTFLTKFTAPSLRTPLFKENFLTLITSSCGYPYYSSSSNELQFV